MYFFVVRKARRKILIALSVLLFWFLMYLASRTAVNSVFAFSVTVGDSFSFSHPYSIFVKNVYTQHDLSEKPSVTCNSPVYCPVHRKLSEYQKDEFAFKYPTDFVLKEQVMHGSEIICHIDFQDVNGNARGFVQVWEMPVTVKEFLENSLKVSGVSFIEFSQKEVKFGKRKWTVWDYTFKGNNGKSYRGLEAFTGQKDRMYRLSYFVPENEWVKKHQDIFTKMLKSFKIR